MVIVAGWIERVVKLFREGEGSWRGHVVHWLVKEERVNNDFFLAE